MPNVSTEAFANCEWLGGLESYGDMNRVREWMLAIAAQVVVEL
jgi:hypothetical protein